jgi:hypothetical protein
VQIGAGDGAFFGGRESASGVVGVGNGAVTGEITC